MNEAWLFAKNRLYNVADFFSLTLLLKTLFAPWRNDVQVASNAALSTQANLWEQNIASRVIGFLIRLIIIFAALLVIGLLAFLAGLYLLGWLLLPLLVVILPIIALLIL